MTEIEIEFLKFIINWVGGMTAVYWLGRGIGWVMKWAE